ncbi:putative transmembrane protein [Halotydeus destructor]|nr:putative transmembrane protein [Halotydeus destructor]
MPRLSDVIHVVSNACSRLPSVRVSVPMERISNFLLGHNSVANDERTNQGRSGSRRQRPHSRSPNDHQVIPPPHSYAVRRSEERISNCTESVLFAEGRPALRSRLPNSFAYSVLGSPAAGSNNQDRDRNVFAAIMSIIVIATLATALAQPKWFSITGGTCTKKYIGLQEFLYITSYGDAKTNLNFKSPNPPKAATKSVPRHSNNGTDKESSIDKNSTRIRIRDIMGSIGVTQQQPKFMVQQPILTANNYNHELEELKRCVTPEIISLQRILITLCFLAIVVNLAQFFLDTLGTSNKCLNVLRANGVGNILGVIVIICIVGTSYLVTSLIEQDQLRSLTLDPPKQVEVRFEISYYLTTLAGVIGLVAAACNLLRRPNNYHYLDSSFTIPEYDQTSILSDNQLQSLWLHSPTSSNEGQLISSIPPPPYAP